MDCINISLFYWPLKHFTAKVTFTHPNTQIHSAAIYHTFCHIHTHSSTVRRDARGNLRLSVLPKDTSAHRLEEMQEIYDVVGVGMLHIQS